VLLTGKKRWSQWFEQRSPLGQVDGLRGLSGSGQSHYCEVSLTRYLSIKGRVRLPGQALTDRPPIKSLICLDIFERWAPVRLED